MKFSEPIRRAVCHLNQNPQAPLDLAALAAVAELSVFHFARRFRAEVGVPPCRYARALRVELAKTKMLAEPNQPLADVALACGYADQSHFTTAFRQVTGMTPRAYRMKHSDP